MLKNLNDYLTLISLIILTVLPIRIVFSYILNSDKEKQKISLFYLLRNYDDNTEE